MDDCSFDEPLNVDVQMIQPCGAGLERAIKLEHRQQPPRYQYDQRYQSTFLMDIIRCLSLKVYYKSLYNYIQTVCKL